MNVTAGLERQHLDTRAILADDVRVIDVGHIDVEGHFVAVRVEVLHDQRRGALEALRCARLHLQNRYLVALTVLERTARVHARARLLRNSFQQVAHAGEYIVATLWEGS